MNTDAVAGSGSGGHVLDEPLHCLGVTGQIWKIQIGGILGDGVDLLRGEVQGDWWGRHVLECQTADEFVVALDLPVHLRFVELPDETGRWPLGIQCLDGVGSFFPEPLVRFVRQHAEQHVFGVGEVTEEGLFLCTLLLILLDNLVKK